MFTFLYFSYLILVLSYSPGSLNGKDILFEAPSTCGQLLSAPRQLRTAMYFTEGLELSLYNLENNLIFFLNHYLQNILDYLNFYFFLLKSQSLLKY